MELREEILRNSGLINDAEYFKDIVLVEGIRFFKNSKRLKSLGRKILKKAGKIKGIKIGVKVKTDLIDFVKKIDEVARAFENTENAFTAAKKMNDKPAAIAAKLKYKELKLKHAEFLKMLKKESVIKALKSVGAIGLATGIALIAYHFLASNAVGMTALVSGAAKSKPSLEAGKTAKEVAQQAVDAAKSKEGVLPFIKQFFVDMTENTKKLFTSGGPTTSELQKMVGQEAQESLRAATAINAGLAATGGLTALGSVKILNKFFSKFRLAKSFKATEKVMQNLKDLKVTTAKEEKEA